MEAEEPSIDKLLQLVPDAPDSVLSTLRTWPHLASKQDSHGYSLLHAATSWENKNLLRALVEEFKVDPNIKDESDETCLFNAESVEFAEELLRLGVTIDAVNDEGHTAADYLDDEDEAPRVAAYLRQVMAERSNGTTATSNGQRSNAEEASTEQNDLPDGNSDAMQPPPPLPNGVQVNIGTMLANEVGEEPDPEIRRRIEALAARQDFEGEEGQRELRNLVEEVISGLGGDGQGAATRRRVG
jgi:hypothetical protein